MAQKVLIRALDAEFKVTANLLPNKPARVTYPKLYTLLSHLPTLPLVENDTVDNGSREPGGQGQEVEAADLLGADTEADDYDVPLPQRIQDDAGQTKLVLLCLFFGAAPFTSGTTLDDLLALVKMIGKRRAGGEHVQEHGGLDDDVADGAVVFPDFEAFYHRILQDHVPREGAAPDEFVCALSPSRRSMASLRLELQPKVLTALATQCKQRASSPLSSTS